MKTTCANPECSKPPRAKGASGPRSPYCSIKCRRRADWLRNREHRLLLRSEKHKANLQPKTCPACSANFVPTKSKRQRFCSSACKSRWHRDNQLATCAYGECDRPVRAKGLCATHYAVSHPNRAKWSKGKVETRRANLRRKTQLRRARIFDSEAEQIDRDEIGERDGWKCGLCARRVDRHLAYPNPLSPSLDHIEPLSKGGKHARQNVQIAHLTCNVAKGNRGGGEQLLLIG